MIIELMDKFIEDSERNCNLSYNIAIDELKANGGIYAEMNPNVKGNQYYSKNEVATVPVLIMIRDKSQRVCMESLEKICEYWRLLSNYPDCDSFKWLDSAVGKTPTKIARDEDGVWHYSCIINHTIYY